jgi:hypothetical protein
LKYHGLLHAPAKYVLYCCRCVYGDVYLPGRSDSETILRRLWVLVREYFGRSQRNATVHRRRSTQEFRRDRVLGSSFRDGVVPLLGAIEDRVRRGSNEEERAGVAFARISSRNSPVACRHRIVLILNCVGLMPAGYKLGGLVLGEGRNEARPPCFTAQCGEDEQRSRGRRG